MTACEYFSDIFIAGICLSVLIFFNCAIQCIYVFYSLNFGVLFSVVQISIQYAIYCILMLILVSFSVSCVYFNVHLIEGHVCILVLKTFARSS